MMMGRMAALTDRVRAGAHLPQSPQIELDVNVSVSQRVSGHIGLDFPVRGVEEIICVRRTLDIVHGDGLLLLVGSSERLLL